MNDLISRQAAIDAVEHYYNEKKYITRSRTILSAICLDMKNTIDSLPSAERTGRWTHELYENAPMLFKDRWICSACGKTNYYGMSDFCPCCGARMENSTRRMKEVE